MYVYLVLVLYCVSSKQYKYRLQNIMSLQLIPNVDGSENISMR